MDDQMITGVLSTLLTHLNLPYSGIRVDRSDEAMIRVDVDSPEASRLIGWHGETINALQHLAKSILRSMEHLERAPFIVVDVDGYRRMQEDKVCRIAEQKADFVRRKNTRVALQPMSPYFRRIVHTFVANNPDMQDLETESIGEGDYRQVVLRLKKNAKTSAKDDGELAPVIEGEGEGKPISEEAEEGFENLDV